MEELTSVGIKETKEVLKFVIELGEAVDKGLEDGKFEMSELGLLIPPLMLIGPAIEDISGVQGEMKDLTPDEMGLLVTYVETELSITNKDTEKIIEDGLALAMRLYAFVSLFGKKDEVVPTPADLEKEVTPETV